MNIPYAQLYAICNYHGHGFIIHKTVAGAWQEFPSHSSAPMTERWCRRRNGEVVITTTSAYSKLVEYANDDSMHVDIVGDLVEEIRPDAYVKRGVYSLDIWLP